MSPILYPYTTVYATTTDLLGVCYRGEVHFFERAIVEIVADGERFWLILLDAASNEPSRCVPLRDPVADFETLIGLEAPQELREVV